jgi:trigger factor
MELIQNKEGLVATLTVKVSPEDYATKVERELKKLRQTSKVKGFRPGNVPMSLIKKMYGHPIMVEEINKLINESIKKFEQENVGHLFGQVIPSTANNQSLNTSNEQTDFEFIYEAGFLPEFTYRIDENTELPYYNIIVEDKAIDKEVDALRNMYCIDIQMEEIEDDCLIEVDIKLVKDGEEKTCTTDFLMTVIPDEYKPLFLGLKVDETVDVEVRKVFTSRADLLGMLDISEEELELQSEVLPFTIIAITKKVPAELNEEFFDNIASKDNIRNETELREYFRDAIRFVYERMSLDMLYEDSLDILEEKANVIMPEDFVRKYVRFLNKEKTEILEEEVEYMTQYFLNEAKWRYIITSLLQQNNIEVTYDMVIEEARRMFKQNTTQQNKHYSDEEICLMVNYYMQNEEYMQNVINRVKTKQVANLLKKNAKLNVVNVTVDEFYELNKKKTNQGTEVDPITGAEANPEVENTENNK